MGAKRGASEGATTRKRLMTKPKSDKGGLTLPDLLKDDEVAAGFWARHAEPLSKADMLSTEDIDAFIICCKCYSRLLKLEKTIDENPKLYRIYLDLQRQFRQCCKDFCLLPTERRRLSISFDNSARHDDKDEFDL